MADKKRILIVDDNPFNRKFLCTVINKIGFETVQADNGGEALEKISDEDFQMIFMDLLMPGIDGYEATKRIRNLGLTVPVIAVSAMSFKHDRRRAMDAGCNDFLPKPVAFNELKTMIEKYLLAPASDGQHPKSFRKDNSDVTSNFDYSEYDILLVEEDITLADAFRKILSKAGFGVSHLTNGTLTLELLKSDQPQPDIIISNVFTSGIDALGLLTIVKREYPNILFFIYTPEYDAAMHQLAIQQSVDGIITQDNFETSSLSMIDSAFLQTRQNGSWYNLTATSQQVRRAQETLISFGCSSRCEIMDIAYSSYHEAGGDMARCQRFNLEGRCGIFLGDVAGHDVMSSYVGATFLGILSTQWFKHQEPMDLLNTGNTELIKLGYQQTHICATAILWDQRRRSLKIASAGNPGGILVTKESDGTFKIIELISGGLCLGLLDENDLFYNDTISLPENSFVFFFSDGIDDNLIKETILSCSELLEKSSSSGLGREILNRLISEHGQHDDMILISLYTPEADQDELHYEFKTGFEGVDKACEWTTTILSKDKVPAEVDYDFMMLVIRETLLNAVEHGNMENSEKYVDISIFFENHSVRVKISDEGRGFDLAKKKKEIGPLDGLQIGKRGIPLILSFADNVEVFGGTVTLTFGKKF